MARKTNNSGGVLANVAALALAVKEDPAAPHSNCPASRNQHERQGDGNGKPRQQTISQGSSSSRSSCSNDESDADIEAADHDSDEADEEEGDDDGPPDAHAPSVRPSIETGDQAGLSSDEDDNEDSTFSPRQQKKRKVANKADRGLRTPKSTASSRRTSQDGDSDDDYAGVDMISDSDEEHPNVEDWETKNIIDTEEANKLSSTILNHHHDLASWDDGDLYGSAFMSDVPYFDEEYARGAGDVFSGGYDPYGHGADSSVFEGFSPQPTSARSPRRVRFQTPVLRRSHSTDADDICLSSSAPAARGPEKFMIGGHDLEIDDHEDDKSSCGSSSGYETDCGETTDEEDVPITTIKRPEDLLRQPSLSSLDIDTPFASTAYRSPFKKPTTPASMRRGPGPRLGMFMANPRKPVAIVDESGENMVIYPAQRPNHITTSIARIPTSAPSSAPMTPTMSHATLGPAPDMSDTDYNDMASQVSADPVLSAGPDFTGAGFNELPRRIHTMGNQDLSPASVFFAIESPEDERNLQGSYEEDDFDIADFLDLGDGSSDEIELDTEPASPTYPSDRVDGSQIPRTSSSPNEDILRHFDEIGVITSFRRGQPQPHGPSRRGNIKIDAFKPLGARRLSNPAPSALRKRKLSETFPTRGGFTASAKRRVLNHR